MIEMIENCIKQYIPLKLLKKIDLYDKKKVLEFKRKIILCFN